MKKLLTFLAICSTSLFVNAQTKLELFRKGYAGIAVGGSLPQEEFGMKQINNLNSGFAKTGIVVDVFAAHRVWKNLGITVVLRGENNPFDHVAYAEKLSESASEVSVSADAWKIGVAMIGLNGCLPFGKKSKSILEIKGMIGIMHSTSPQIVSIIYYDSFGNDYSRYDKASDISTAYLVGITYRYNFSNRLGLIVNADRLNSSPEYEINYFEQYNSSFNNDYIKGKFSRTPKYVTYNISAGVTYLFN